jgi:hypothetical protein
VRLTDAHFIWTEPHSKRLRVSMTIQKEVLTATVLEQVFEIEYLVQHGQCPDCTKLAAKNTWKALVQVRQKVSHKRTFLYLEQLILKHGAQKDTISVKEVRDGLDFFYSSRSHAIKMVEFLQSVVPIRYVPLYFKDSAVIYPPTTDQKRPNSYSPQIHTPTLPTSNTRIPSKSSQYAKMISFVCHSSKRDR